MKIIKKLNKNAKKTKKSKKSKNVAGSMRTTTIFTNGQSQAVRIPKEFRLGGKQVYIKREGNCIILIPMDNPWELLIESLNEFSSDFMANGRELLPDQEREDMFP